MASQSGSAGFAVVDGPARQPMPVNFRHIVQLLEEEPFRVKFFQAVRLLQRMEGKPVGAFAKPEEESVRFSSLPSLTYPPSELFSLDRMKSGQYKMAVQFMGLCAAVAALPPPYTEEMLQRISNTRFREDLDKRENDEQPYGDYAMRDFFDIFNHRMISFFYRGWEKYRFFIEYEKSGQDRLSARLLNMLGLGIAGLQGEHRISDQACLGYFSLLARNVRTVSSLRQILEDYFDIPVTIHQFEGTWHKLDTADQTEFEDDKGSSELLGVGVVAGDEVWDHHGRIRVVLGPMSFERYVEFLPEQRAYLELCEWLRFYSNRMFDTQVQLILRREDTPKCDIWASRTRRPRLGFVSWLKTKEMDLDPDDATYLVR